MVAKDNSRATPGAPMVSVIVPFRDVGPLLCRAIDSIVASTHANLEVFIIDDGSGDGSASHAREYAGEHDCVRLLVNEENRGVSFSRNRGIAEASGDYLLFVDADDYITSDWIEGLVHDAVAQDADVVIGRSRKLQGGQESEYAMKGLGKAGPVSFRSFVFRDNCVIWNKLYRASMIRDTGISFDEAIAIGEDLLFNYRALAVARTIYAGDAGHYCYNADHASSAIKVSTPESRIANLALVLDRLLVERDQGRGGNRQAPRQVAREILLEHYAASAGPLDATVLKQIRSVSLFIEVAARLKAARGARRM